MPEMIDHYRIDNMLGQGGMGVVYQATDVNLERPVAIKVMHSHLAAQPEFQQRFLQEARAAASLDHPNIVRVLDSGYQDGQLYLVMELVSGGSLRDYLQHLRLRRTLLDLPEVTQLGGQVANALAYAHGRGMVHRDVKPDNVLLKPITVDGVTNFQAVLTDFGLAKLAESVVESLPGQTMGTFSYMSPEQALGQAVDGRSDIYSLGVMLYELATGRLPFLAQTLTQAIRMHTSEALPPPESIRAGLPPELVRVITRSLEKDPANRYQSAGEMARDLQQVHDRLANNQITLPEPPEMPTDSLATYLMSDPGTMRQSSIAQQPVSAAQRSSAPTLVIVAADGIIQRVPLLKDHMVIGRDPGSDIALPNEKVSRSHSRLDRHPDGTFSISDLGSTNGTWLNNRRLTPNTAELWPAGQPVNIGDFTLTVEAAAGAASAARPTLQQPVAPSRPAVPGATLAGVGVPSRPGSTASPSSRANPTISATASPLNFEIRPGAGAELFVEVQYAGGAADSFGIQVTGLPPAWSSVPAEPLQLFPGDRGNFRVRFHPPANATAGRYPFQIVVGSRSRNDVSTTLNGNAQVSALSDFTVELQPQRLSRSGDAMLIVTNNGNATANYLIVGTDPTDAVVFNIQQSQFSLAAGQTGQLPIQVLPKKRPVIGGTSLLPFEIGAQEAREGGTVKTQQGEVLVTPTLPIWTLGVALIACLCISVAGIAGLGLFRPNTATPNATLDLTSVAFGMTNTQNAILTSTVLAGTATATPTPTYYATDTTVPLYFPSDTAIFLGPYQTLTAAAAFQNSVQQTAAVQTATAIGNSLYASQQAAILTATAQSQAQNNLIQTVTAQIGQLTQAAGNQTTTAQAGNQANVIQSATALYNIVAGTQTAGAMTATAQGALQVALGQTATAQSQFMTLSAATSTAGALTAVAANNQTSAAGTAFQQANQTKSVQTNTALTMTVGAIQTHTGETSTAAAIQTATAVAGQSFLTQTAVAVQQTNAAAAAQQTNAAAAAQQTNAAAAQQQTNAALTAVAGGQQQTNVALTAAVGNQQTALAQTAVQSGNLTSTAVAGAAALQQTSVALTAVAGNAQQTNVALTAVAGGQQTAIAQQTAVAAGNAQQTDVALTAIAGAAAGQTQTAIAAANSANLTATAGAVSNQPQFVQVADPSNISGAGTVIQNPTVNGNPGAIMFVSPNWGPSNVFNPHSVGVIRTGDNKWAIINQDSAGMPQGAGFNVVALGAAPNVFLYQASPANTSGPTTTIDNAAINGHPELIMNVTLNNVSGAPNPHPIAVAYDGGANKWTVTNLDGAAMPQNAAFNVAAQNAGGNAFSVTADGGNTSNNEVLIDNGGLNGHPEMIVFVTSVSGATNNPHNVGVYYVAAQNKWAIFNEDPADPGNPGGPRANMPQGVAFHVTFVNP